MTIVTPPPYVCIKIQKDFDKKVERRERGNVSFGRGFFNAHAWSRGLKIITGGEGEGGVYPVCVLTRTLLSISIGEMDLLFDEGK